MGFRVFAAVAVVAAAACSTSTPAGGDDDVAVGDDAGANPRPDDAAPPPRGPDAAVEPSDVRFVVMGDTGEGNESQHKVADQIAAKCAAARCDFVVLLGDNIYDDGVASLDDPQWDTKFEEPYADLDLPFYAVLGNHDYGGQLIVDTPGLGNEWDKGPLEVQYTELSDKWVMPATHYTLRVGNVGFIMLDTNSILWDSVEHGDQRAWYATALEEVSGADWVFAAAHHPYRSNGAHGNAGAYESIEVGGIEVPNPVPILNGNFVQAFYDEYVCGTVDVAFAGHDHNRQWLDEPAALCGAELIVSGAGCKVKDFSDRGNLYHYQDATTPGFLYVVVDGLTLTGEFIDENGVSNFTRTIQK